MNRFDVALAGAGYGALTIVPELSLSVSGGEVMVLLGSNGAGKTTSLRAVVGTVRTRNRSVRLDGEDLSPLSAWQLARRAIAFVPDGARCFANARVIDNLTGALEALKPKVMPAERKRLFDRVFDLFPILHERRRQLAGSMSGGQRQMLAISRALMIEPRVMILDEPSAGLAPKLVEEVFEALGRIKAASGCAILMAEQNVAAAMSIADRCLILSEGRVMLQGDIDDVRNDERLRVAYLGL
ncbi:ABC transporter ATP-binding protein [Pseudaminobacter arsenicus]|uniref:ABC transporter ATP-binding protein n=1 Tax=Borborobacter arsenicus TaxID=1851146 RepID=A0A432V3A9_9HYPH|nr:ABC transporter ATP-binding protein [Pseudaminobacter arsenicus]RUM96689.1 ABC transporter ATP-binding protein [Pseudaminobacter arsenicus]